MGFLRGNLCVSERREEGKRRKKREKGKKSEGEEGKEKKKREKRKKKNVSEPRLIDGKMSEPTFLPPKGKRE